MSYEIAQRISEERWILSELGFPPDEKFAVYDDESFTSAGISIPHHGKMPDVIVYFDGSKFLGPYS